MNISVKDPSTGALLEFDAKPGQQNGIHGYYIRHSNGSGFFIAHRLGTWRLMDDHLVEPELLVNIGLALEGYKISEQLPYISDKED